MAKQLLCPSTGKCDAWVCFRNQKCELEAQGYLIEHHVLINVFGDALESDDGSVMEFVQPMGHHITAKCYGIMGRSGLRWFQLHHRSEVDGKFIYREVTE